MNPFITSCHYHKKLKNLSSFGLDYPSNIFNHNNIFLIKSNYDNNTYFNRNKNHKDNLPNLKQKNSTNNKNSSREKRGYNRPNGKNEANRNNSVGQFFSKQIIRNNYIYNYNKDNSFDHNSNLINSENDKKYIYSRINSIINFIDDLKDELNDELNLMSLINRNNTQPRIALLARLLDPSAQQKFKLKLKKIKMNKNLFANNDKGKNEKPICCICLRTMKINDEVSLLKCQHLFHFKCLDKWIETKEDCPICRNKIEFGKKFHKKYNKKLKDINENIKDDEI
jgi:hypothetical protein